jgi:ribosomal protein L19E
LNAPAHPVRDPIWIISGPPTRKRKGRNVGMTRFRPSTAREQKWEKWIARVPVWREEKKKQKDNNRNPVMRHVEFRS